MTHSRWTLCVVALGILPLVGCSSERSALATAPSMALTAAAAEQSAVTGARVSTLEETGNLITSLVAGTSCPTLEFKISTYLIKTDAATVYSGGSCVSLQAGTRVSLTVAATGTDSSTVYAKTVTIRTTTTTPVPAPEPPKPTPPTSTPVNGEAPVTSLVTSQTGCPALTFVVGGLYPVTVSAATQYEGGGSCAAIKVGTTLRVTGTRVGDNPIVATNIEFKGGSMPEPPRPVQPVEGEGVITRLATPGCPALQFFIGQYLIKLDSATLFAGGQCTDLKLGVKVAVKGSVNADGSVSASSITLRTETPRPEPEVEGEGFVTALVSGTACPALKLQVGEYTVTLTASTQFAVGGCSGLAVGRKISVRGTMTGDKTATASLITFKN